MAADKLSRKVSGDTPGVLTSSSTEESLPNVSDADVVEARLDLAVEWLLAAVGTGHISLDDMRSDPDMYMVRTRRAEGFYAAEQIASIRKSEVSTNRQLSSSICPPAAW